MRRRGAIGQIHESYEIRQHARQVIANRSIYKTSAFIKTGKPIGEICQCTVRHQSFAVGYSLHLVWLRSKNEHTAKPRAENLQRVHVGSYMDDRQRNRV